MQRVLNRSALLALLDPGSVGAELGVLDGAFSVEIMRVARPSLLYLVDLFTGTTRLARENGDGKWEPFQPTPAEAWEAVRRRLSAEIELGHVQIVCAEACAWLRSVPHGFLDWLYLDDDHSYTHVARELELAKTRVKPGGWIMGHDYCEVLPDVRRAVDEFCTKHRLQIDVLTDEAPLPVYPRPAGYPEVCSYNSYAIRLPA